MRKRLLLIFCAFLFAIATQATEKNTYLVELDYPNLGKIDFYMTFEMDKDDHSFLAYSNKKTLYRLLPFYQKMYLKLFGKDKKNGAVLRILDGKIKSDSLHGKLISTIGSFNFAASKNIDELRGKLYNKNIELDFTAKKVVEKTKISNYNKLFQNLQHTLRNNIYNPKILNREDWDDFMENLQASLSNATDDLDVLFAFLYHKRNLKTSHVFLSKTDYLKSATTENATIKPNYDFRKIDNSASLLEITAFSLNDKKAISKLVKNCKTPNLIIDLRDCSGGDFSSLLLASHFIEEEKMVGYFLGNKYYKNYGDQLPSEKKIKNITPFTDGTLNDFFTELHDNGILVGKVEPAATSYNGKVFLLTSNKTASAAEPLAFFMKENNLATLVGENTAGAMLSAESFKLENSWFLTLPVANYFTIDNRELEQIGVKPDIETKAENALEKVKYLIK